MTPLAVLSSTLQALHPRLRAALYQALMVIGAGLALAVWLGLDDGGTLTRALQVYATVSPVVGAVAVANVKTRTQVQPMEDEEDVDLSAFEPVGEVDEVFGSQLS